MLHALTACTIHLYDAVIFQRTRRGLRSSAVNQSLRLYCDYLRNFSVPTDLKWRCWPSWRPYRAAKATPLHFYCVFIRTPSRGAYFVLAQSTRRRIAYLLTIPQPMKMMLWCCTDVENSTVCTMTFCIFRNAARSPQERSPGVTGVI